MLLGIPSQKSWNPAIRNYSLERNAPTSAMENGFPARFDLQEQIGKLVYLLISEGRAKFFSNLRIILVRVLIFMTSYLLVLPCWCFLVCITIELCRLWNEIINVFVEEPSVSFDDASTRGAIECVRWKLWTLRRCHRPVALQKKVGYRYFADCRLYTQHCCARGFWLLSLS